MFEIIGLIFIQVFLLVLGAVLGTACALFVLLLTRGVADPRAKRLAVVTAFLFPLTSVLYFEAGLMMHDVVRYATGKDSILNGLYHYPLGNDYQLVFFNETAPEGGWIDVPRQGSLPVDRIYSLQVAGDLLFMHADPQVRQGTEPTVTVGHGLVPQPVDTQPLHSYLELNTKTHERSDYLSLEELNRAAASRNIQLKLLPIDDFYNKTISAASASWLFLGILATPLVIVGVRLSVGLYRLRSQRSSMGVNGSA